MRKVSLNVHLRFFALSRGRQRDDPKNSRAHPGGNSLDDAALARAVAPFENDANLLRLVAHPFLQLDKLDVQFAKLSFIGFTLKPWFPTASSLAAAVLRTLVGGGSFAVLALLHLEPCLS